MKLRTASPGLRVIVKSLAKRLILVWYVDGIRAEEAGRPFPPSFSSLFFFVTMAKHSAFLGLRLHL